MKLFSNKVITLLILQMPFISLSYAATPDAGQTLQQLTPKLDLQKKSEYVIDSPALTSGVALGGKQIEIKKIRLSGNKVYKADYIREQALGGEQALNKYYDLAGMKGLADQISLYYRANGYPFATAYLPQQEINNGLLDIFIVEGEYGEVVTQVDDKQLNQEAQTFLSQLTPGSVIESKSLERATLLLSDQPGINVKPIMQPSKVQGRGDLIVEVKKDKVVTASIGADNHGNRYTGQNKLRANLNFNSPFMLGDQITLNALYGDHQDRTGLWFGGIGYNLPLNGDGLRASINYSRTAYQIGKNFSDSQLKGIADIYSAGLSYALIRGQKTNINLNASTQYKVLADENKPNKSVELSTDNKSSISLPVALTFDTRDTIWGGGILFGGLTWTKGSLFTDKDYPDENRIKGDFDKLNLDIVRLQSLPENFTLFLRGSAQWSNKNLDSSEGFGIGGVTGVRAYPTGEGYGNVGWVSQTELRYALDNNFNPYVFYDIGSTTANQTTVGVNDTREVSGTGLGLRYTQDDWSADVSAAWRLNGGRPEDEATSDDAPRIWASVSYQL